mmetsp:Transcript_42606/g.98746  ORF Transcript_42606/g.98746 Transcript_42606/m.98746 type:complete len:80 (+) Transcript_42606:1-240(+)
MCEPRWETLSAGGPSQARAPTRGDQREVEVRVTALTSERPALWAMRALQGNVSAVWLPQEDPELFVLSGQTWTMHLQSQ